MITFETVIIPDRRATFRRETIIQDRLSTSDQYPASKQCSEQVDWRSTRKGEFNKMFVIHWKMLTCFVLQGLNIVSHMHDLMVALSIAKLSPGYAEKSIFPIERSTVDQLFIESRSKIEKSTCWKLAKPRKCVILISQTGSVLLNSNRFQKTCSREKRTWNGR